MQTEKVTFANLHWQGFSDGFPGNHIWTAAGDADEKGLHKKVPALQPSSPPTLQPQILNPRFSTLIARPELLQDNQLAINLAVGYSPPGRPATLPLAGWEI
jgi:hypothetical protein